MNTMISLYYDHGVRILIQYHVDCVHHYFCSIYMLRQVLNIRCVINDGQSHPVDSSDLAFQQAAIGAFREAYLKANPCILEPIMKVVVEGPSEFQGNIFASINQRRGIISSSTEDGTSSRVEAEVPLSEMFGYSTVLRSLTQGKAEFTMEFEKYSRAPLSISEELIKNFAEKKKKEHK